MAYRKYSAMTPGGMSKDLGLKFAGATKGKKATTLFLLPTLLARVARKLPRCKALSMRRLGRKPFVLVDQDAVRTETAKLVQSFQPARLRVMLSRKAPKQYISLARVTINCGYNNDARPDWLVPMAKDKLPQPAKEFFPKKAKFQVPGQSRVSQNRIKVASAARVSGRNAASGPDTKNAPEEIYFKSTKALISNRNALPGKVIKKLARRPMKLFK